MEYLEDLLDLRNDLEEMLENLDRYDGSDPIYEKLIEAIEQLLDLINSLRRSKRKGKSNPLPISHCNESLCQSLTNLDSIA